MGSFWRKGEENSPCREKGQRERETKKAEAITAPSLSTTRSNGLCSFAARCMRRGGGEKGKVISDYAVSRMSHNIKEFFFQRSKVLAVRQLFP